MKTDSYHYNDLTLPAAYGIPAISIPQLCPYCHRGCLGIVSDRQLNSDTLYMYIYCYHCEASSPVQITHEILDKEIHRNKFLLMNNYLRQISHLPPDMLLRPGDMVNFVDPFTDTLTNGCIEHIKHGGNGLFFDLVRKSEEAPSKIRYHLHSHYIRPLSVKRVDSLTQFQDRTGEAFSNI